MKSLLINKDLAGSFEVKNYERSEFVLPFHEHENIYEITLIIRGKGIRIIGDYIGNYEPGDLIFVGPNVPHVWKNQSTGSKKQNVRAISIKFTNHFPIKGFFELKEMENVLTLLKSTNRGIKLNGKINRDVGKKMLTILDQPSAKQLLIILDILIAISESDEYNYLASAGFGYSKNKRSNKLDVIIPYIFDHLTQKITTQQLADILDIHPSSVGRFFKKNTGYTTTEYLNQIRIGCACRLLMGKNTSISNACFASGFNNLSHFNRLFLKIKKMTPTNYLNELRKNKAKI